MPHRMLTLKEVAEYLHLHPGEVEELVRSGEIPFERRGSQVMFRLKEVDAWATRRLLGLPKKELRAFHQRASAKARTFLPGQAVVPELLRPEWIEPALGSRTKPSVLREMVKLAQKTGRVTDEGELLDTLVQRERLASTALSGGVALLHPEHHRPYLVEGSFVVVGRAVQPVPFGAPDGQTTDLFFLVCCEDDRSHLHVLARLCMMCHHTEVLGELRRAKDAAEMFEALVTAERDVLRAT